MVWFEFSRLTVTDALCVDLLTTTYPSKSFVFLVVWLQSNKTHWNKDHPITCLQIAGSKILAGLYPLWIHDKMNQNMPWLENLKFSIAELCIAFAIQKQFKCQGIESQSIFMIIELGTYSFLLCITVTY